MSRSRRTFLTTLAAASVTLPLAGCAGGDEQSADEEAESMNDEGMTDSMEGGETSSSMAQENNTAMDGSAMTESMTEAADGESMGDDEMNDGMTENETTS